MFAKKLDIPSVLRYNFSRDRFQKGSTFVDKSKTVKKTAEKPAKAPRKWDPELILAVFLLIFIVLAVALTAVLVVSYVSDPPTDTGETEGEGNGGEDAARPVFSGGVYPTVPTVGASSVSVSTLDSAYAALIDAESGTVLAHKNGEQKFHPASMTKVMTLIVACEQLTEEDLEREVVLTEDVRDFVTSGIYAGSSCHGFDVDDKVRIKDLLYGIGIVSGADCTMMTVQAIFDSVTPKRAEEKFVDLMNLKAEEMGLKNTHFENSVGVEGEEHYTTATEMAAILSYALECPLIEDILSSSVAYKFYIKYTVDGEVKNLSHTYYSTLFNTNPEAASRIKAYEAKMQKKFALNDLELTGGKTGTLGGGSNRIYSLATFADGNGKRYILITGETSLAYGVMTDAKTMYDTYAK